MAESKAAGVRIKSMRILPAMASPGARTYTAAGEQPSFQVAVGDVLRQRPAQARRLEPAQRQPHRRRGCSHTSRNLPGRNPGRLQSDHIAHMAHRKPLHRHPGPPSQSRKAGPCGSQKRPHHPGFALRYPGATSSRNGGRHRAESAKNCRTSVKIIEEFYASHIKNMIDASIINVRHRQSKAASDTPASASIAPRKPAAERRIHRLKFLGWRSRYRQVDCL